MTLQYVALSGAAMAQYMDELAQLRIRVFREFPYLYDGDEAYEKRYLQTYLNAPRSLMVLATDGGTVVGGVVRHTTGRTKPKRCSVRLSPRR